MIFNKNEQGATELKEMIGWIYKSIDFNNLKTYIRFAEREVVKIISKEVYRLAEDHYASEDYEATDSSEMNKLLTELVHYIQLPIALLAYRKYAPGVDVQHSEAGRQISVGTELKPAFEWMIERDNNNILDLYHESMEILLEFLDAQTDIIIPDTGVPEDPPTGGTTEDNTIESAWRASAAFEESKSLLVSSVTEFEKVFPINSSRRLYITVVPFIRQVENQYIRSTVLASVYDSIKEKIKDKEPLTDEEKQIIELARQPIVLFTMAMAVMRLSMELLPDRVIQNYSSLDPKQSTVADSNDRRGFAALLEKDALKSLIPLQSFIRSMNQVVEEEEVIDTTKPFFRA